MSLLYKKCQNGHLNPPQAQVCSRCGLPLDPNGSPAVAKNIWVRQEDDIAAKVDASDLKGLFIRGIIIEPGTKALLVDGGAVKDTLGPGTHYLDSLDKRLFDWIQTGIGSQVSVLLVSMRPMDLEFNAGGVFTNDPLRVGVRIRVQVEVAESGKFLINMLGSRERYTKLDLTGYLYPQVSMVVEKWIGRLSAQQLAEDLSLREKLELGLSEELAQSFGQAGLKFNFVRALEFNLEHLDKIKGIRSSYSLQIAEAQAQQEGKQSLFKIMREGKLLEWAQETAKVEDEERKAELYERMRQTVMAGKMQEIRSEAEFETFLDQIDRSKLLREKERDELLRTWKESAEDHNLARAYLLEKLRLEQTYQTEKIKIIQSNDLDHIKLDGEISVARKKTDFEIENRRKFIAEEFSLEREKLKLAKDKNQVDVEMAEINRKMKLAEQSEKAALGLELLEKMKRIRRIDAEESKRIDREDTLKTNEAEFTREAQRFEMSLKMRQAEMDFALKQAQISSPIQMAQISAEKEMSADQLLARNAANSAAAAKALEEKFKAEANANTGALERERELSERQRREKDAEIQRMLEANDKNAARTLDQNKHSTEQLSNMGQAFARGSGGAPVIITGSGSGQVIQPQNGYHSTEAAADKTCSGCGKHVAVSVRFCPHCGHQFTGMGS